MISTLPALSAGSTIPASTNVASPTRPGGSVAPNGSGSTRGELSRPDQVVADRFVTVADLETLDGSRSAGRASAPAGTDPALWRALSSDERAFFAHTPRSDAPVYSRLSISLSASAPPLAPAPAMAPVHRGLHLDLRA